MSYKNYNISKSDPFKKIMRRRRIYFKRRKRRYKQRGRECKAATNCWRPRKQFGKGEPEYIYQLWGL